MKLTVVLNEKTIYLAWVVAWPLKPLSSSHMTSENYRYRIYENFTCPTMLLLLFAARVLIRILNNLLSLMTRTLLLIAVRVVCCGYELLLAEKNVRLLGCIQHNVQQLSVSLWHVFSIHGQARCLIVRIYCHRVTIFYYWHCRWARLEVHSKNGLISIKRTTVFSSGYLMQALFHNMDGITFYDLKILSLCILRYYLSRTSIFTSICVCGIVTQIGISRITYWISIAYIKNWI